MRTLSSLGVLLCGVALAAPAAAQGGSGGVDNSGMGQGQARITSRADVRLSMESMRGTGGAAMSALGQRVGADMARIRRCYEDRVAEDPTVTGTLRLRFLLDGRRPRIEVDRDNVGDAPLLRCITRVLSRLDVARLTRPTHAIVALQLANTAARGAEASAERADDNRAVTLTTDAEGNPMSSGGTPDGRVRFTVTGDGRESATAVAAAHRGLLSALPGLMDCRRRSGRRGRAPGGELRATMRVREGRPPSARTRPTELDGERRPGWTARCVDRVLDQIEHRDSEGRGRVQVAIHFARATEVELAED